MILVKATNHQRNNLPDEGIAKESNSVDEKRDDEDVNRPNFAYDRIRDVEERNANHTAQCYCCC